jgi:bacillolysin
LLEGVAGSGAFASNPANGDCNMDLQNGLLRLESPIISIPAAATAPVKMAFNRSISTEINWDGGNLKYSINGGNWTLMPSSTFTFNPYNLTLNTTAQGNDNPMQAESAFSGGDGGAVDESWGQSQLNFDETETFSEIKVGQLKGSRERGFSVFPNPTGDFIQVKMTDASVENAVVSLSDIDGKLVFNKSNLSFENGNGELNLQELPTGIYFLQMMNAEEVWTERLVKH